MVWQSSTNEDTAFPWWYDEGTPLSRTCQFSEMGRGSTQEPPCRLFEQFNFSALLSQSGITFDQFRLVQLHQNLPQSKDVESILRTEVHVGSTNFPVRFYWIVFCAWDAFHNRNSQWCFWASVCEQAVCKLCVNKLSVSKLCVDSCVWVSCVWASCVWTSCLWTSWVWGRRREEEEAGGSAQPKTRTPHKDVWKNLAHVACVNLVWWCLLWLSLWLPLLLATETKALPVTADASEDSQRGRIWTFNILLSLELGYAKISIPWLERQVSHVNHPKLNSLFQQDCNKSQKMQDPCSAPCRCAVVHFCGPVSSGKHLLDVLL